MQTEHEMRMDVIKDMVAGITGLLMLSVLCLIVGNWMGVV